MLLSFVDNRLDGLVFIEVGYVSCRERDYTDVDWDLEVIDSNEANPCA